ncbi:MAG: hypothetical protein JXR19_10015 [Bacteroidia bacterium]
MKKIKGIVMLIALVAFISSCQEEYEPEMYAGHQIAGEWYVTYNLGGTDVGHGYSTMLTFNTAANDGAQIWVSDEAHFWDFKAKVAANPEGMSFGQSDSLENQAYPVNIVIKNGKVITDGGKSKTGVVTDSIYMVVGFGDDTPGTEYVVSGHRRTGFVEDDF